MLLDPAQHVNAKERELKNQKEKEEAQHCEEFRGHLTTTMVNINGLGFLLRVVPFLRSHADQRGYGLKNPPRSRCRTFLSISYAFGDSYQMHSFYGYYIMDAQERHSARRTA